MTAQVTTAILWKGAIVFALADLVLLVLLLCLLPPKRFFGLRRWVPPCAFLVWFGIWLGCAVIFWEPVYAHLFPAWSRWLLPPAMGLLFASLSRVMWRLAWRWSLPPALTFVLLGAALGPLTHLWGLTRGLMDKPPMLQGASPAAALAVAAPEFGFYFGVILLLAYFIARAKAPSTPARSPSPGGTT